jgi:hypothetical protein
MLESSELNRGECILELFDYSTNNQEPWFFEHHPSFESARARIAEVWQAHRVKYQYPNNGIEVRLRNYWGGHLRIGISEPGWLLIMRIGFGEPGWPTIFESEPFVADLPIRSTREDDGESVFFLLGNSEFTRDYPKSLVHSEANAVNAVADWVRRGEMYLQLPDPYPDRS